MQYHMGVRRRVGVQYHVGVQYRVGVRHRVDVQYQVGVRRRVGMWDHVGVRYTMKRWVRLLGKDFPGRTVDKALPANAGHTGRPWSGKTPHAAEQLSLRSAGRDAATVGSPGTTVKSSLHWPQFEKARVRQGRPRVTKIK
ncbi:unnamed protein product [Rangifer tarandus platyrhynchus]|uniref:Uncharacterized protein n=1 Tax=Rangifer tarandus platyrhynchus TaxID=3082113 RepID=A0ACB1MLD8_RANTA